MYQNWILILKTGPPWSLIRLAHTEICCLTPFTLWPKRWKICTWMLCSCTQSCAKIVLPQDEIQYRICAGSNYITQRVIHYVTKEKLKLSCVMLAESVKLLVDREFFFFFPSVFFYISEKIICYLLLTFLFSKMPVLTL